MFSDKRSGDVLVSELLVSHGRPHKPAVFITMPTDYIDTGGAVSPLRRAVPTGQLTAHTEKGLPLEKSQFPLASSLKNFIVFPLLMPSLLMYWGTACPVLGKVIKLLSSCCLSPWSQSGACTEGSSFQLLSHLSWAAWPWTHCGRKLHLLETMSIFILFTKFCIETHFP